ncbi:MAG: flavin reductase family protein [Bacillales bacterium]|nr:flavin reductase family protein [Bacillales bacterium]
MKIDGQKRSCLKPQPKIIVSMRDKDGRDNALVIGYAGNCSFNPPMIMIAIHPSRFSHHIIKETGEFVVNVVTKENVEMYDYLGRVSGKDEDKFKVMDIKTEEGEEVNAPLLKDCPVNIECRVKDSIMMGSHELFFGEVLKVHVDSKYATNDGMIKYDQIDIL